MPRSRNPDQAADQVRQSVANDNQDSATGKDGAAQAVPSARLSQSGGSYPPGDGLDYVRRFYRIDPHLGQRVRCNGKPGTIVFEPTFPNHYIAVEFDADSEGRPYRSPCHPTWEMEYL